MKKDYTHLVMVLDRSGSMEKMKEEAITGFNNFIEEQKAVPGTATLSLYQFHDRVNLVVDRTPLASVPKLSPETYRTHGFTALLDAMGLAIDETGKWLSGLREEERPENVVVVVLTDGENNASRRYTREAIKEKIETQSGTYKWHFAFLAANQDAILSGGSFGIQQKAALTFAADGCGLLDALRSTSCATTRLRACSAAGYSYSDQDRALQYRGVMTSSSGQSDAK